MEPSGISKTAAVIIAVVVTAVLMGIMMYAVFFYHKGSSVIVPPAPVSNYQPNTIYLTTYRSQPVLLLNRSITPPPSSNDNFQYYQNAGLSDAEIKGLNITAIMQVSGNTQVFSMKMSDDKTFLIFTDGPVQGLSTLAVYGYRYDIVPKTTALLFSSTDTDYPATMKGPPQIKSISPDNRYGELYIGPCYDGCDGYGETVLMDFGAKRFKNLGAVSVFQWTLNGGFQYKNVVTVQEGQEGCSGPSDCPKDPATLPWKQGSWQ